MNPEIENRYKALLSRLHAEVLKPMGFKKEGSNFRQFQSDGLCRIINFQRSAWNSDDECRFCINIGIYYERQTPVTNRKFKEYECLIRTRASGISSNPLHKGDCWWSVFESRDMDKLFEELKMLLLDDVMPWFEQVPARKDAVSRYGFRFHYHL